jgi:PKD repeat protein
LSQDPYYQGSAQFALPGPPGPPAASFTSTCSALSCTFNSGGSTGIAPLTYAWSFGDGGTSTSATPSHTYASANSYAVTLTVTDPSGATALATHNVSVVLPSIRFVGASSTTANSATETVHAPSTIAAGNGLVLIATSGSAVALTAPSGWTAVANTTSPTMYSAVWERVATAADAGSAVSVKFGGTHKGSVELLAYSGTSASSPVAAVAGATKETSTSNLITPVLAGTGAGQELISYWAGRSSVITTLTPPTGVTARRNETGTGGGLVISASGDSGTAIPGGLAAAISPAVGHSVTWSILLTPAG